MRPAGEDLDRLALRAAQGGVDRRGVLRAALAATAVGLLGPFRGLLPAEAQAGGGMCAPGERAVPIRDTEHLAMCSKKVPKENYTPTYNGCGPDGLDYVVPDNLPGIYDFLGPCKQHDICYGTCGSSQAQCDEDFRQGNLAHCTQRHGARWSSLGFECRRLAEVYYRAVSSGGAGAHADAQVQACACCETDCLSCSCNNQLYTSIQECQSACRVSLGCFTGICQPVSSDMCQ